MLRMAHRILNSPNHTLVGWAKREAANIDTPYPQLLQGMDSMKFRVAQSQIIVADNVAEYFASHPQQEWDFEDDFHCVVPPFEHTFVEWTSPKRVLLPDGWQDVPRSETGWSFYRPEDKKLGMAALQIFAGKIEAEDAIELRRQYDAARWIVVGDLFVFLHGFECAWTGLTVFIFVSNEGRAVKILSFPLHPAASTCATMLHEAFLALSFLHCKNVVRTDATETEGPPAKWLRRMKQPTLRYHTLQIDPMKEVLRTEGESETNGLKKALHICRGHFATYTPDKPLFGRPIDKPVTVWVPQHVRGSKAVGEVRKDYTVSAPRQKETPVR